MAQVQSVEGARITDFSQVTISNNFMFRLVMEKPDLCRQLLERVHYFYLHIRSIWERFVQIYL